MNKRKLRFNAVDVLLLLLLAGVVAVVLYIFVFSDRQADPQELNTRTIQYVVMVQDVEEKYGDLVRKGQPVTDAIERKNIGQVVGVQVSPYIKTTFDYESGRETESVAAGRISLKITVEAEAVETDRAFTVDGCVIRIGKKYSLAFPNFYGVGFCIDLNDRIQK